MSDHLGKHQLRRRVKISLPLSDVFTFFSAAENLNRLTPPWLDFNIVTALPVKMARHTLIDYSLKINAIRLKWKTEITHWDPPHCFVDKQIRGPYKLWIHKHLFREENSATIMEDIVTYSVPGSFLEPIVHRYFVKPRLNRIFDYRQESLKKILESE